MYAEYGEEGQGGGISFVSRGWLSEVGFRMLTLGCWRSNVGARMLVLGVKRLEHIAKGVTWLTQLISRFHFTGKLFYGLFSAKRLAKKIYLSTYCKGYRSCTRDTYQRRTCSAPPPLRRSTEIPASRSRCPLCCRPASCSRTSLGARKATEMRAT